MGGVLSGVRKESAESSGLRSKKKFKTVRSFRKTKIGDVNDQYLKSKDNKDSGELRFSFLRQLVPMTPPRKTGDARKSCFLGKVGTAGLEKAVEVLDVLGSGVANLNSSGLISGTAIRGNKISVLAFEVANTITKGTSLMQSLSEENVNHVKQNIFNTEGVQCLVSTDVKVLQSIAASDKREELEIFCREVIRFGNLCKDPQWHNLDRFFSK